MKIPTANIVVAFNKETMERLFSSGATYKSLVAELSDGNEDALLFNNVANPNFISFEHSLGLGGGMKMVLTFIDPKGEFESRFVTTNPAKIIKEFSNPEAQSTKSFITDKPDDVKQSQEEYSKEYVAQFKAELEKSIGQREIYVAYGTGNNLNLWSGPHRTILTNANIDIKGARKITITLTPTATAFDIGQRRGSYNEKVNLNLQGLKVRYAGESQEVKFLDNIAYDPTEYLDIPDKNKITTYRDETQEALAAAGFSELSSKLERFDFHTIIVDAIRSYVQKATGNKNVIVLLPNINLICRQAINDEARKYNLIQSAVDKGAPAASNLVSKIPVFGGFLSDRVNDLHAQSQTTLGKEEMFLEGTLKSFGLRLHTADKGKAEKLQKQADPNGMLAALAAHERHPVSKDAVQSFYEKRYFTAVIDKTDRQVPDHTGVLKTIFDKIKALSQESYKMSSLAIINETDINVLKAWGSKSDKNPWSKFYTLAGYDEFTENSSPVIVGDLALIKEYLYGGVDLDQKAENINQLKSKAKQVKEEKKEGEEEGPTSADYLISAASQIPLHPLDKILLDKKEYNKNIREIVNPVLKGVGAFGDISYLPDDFAYQDASFTDEEKQYIDENGIPTFRYNTQNPNILDMKFKFGGVYFAALKTLGYQKEIKRLTSAVAEGVLPTGIGTFPIRSRGAAIAYMRTKGFSMGLGDDNKKQIINSIAAKISPELAKELEVDSSEAAADSIAAILEDEEKTNLKGLILVDQELPGNPNSILADLSEDVYRKALQMSITTLPTFHISRPASLSSPCIVFAQDQPITQSVRLERNLMNKFFSGLYKIMGFKHTITTSAASSEFKLVKNAPSFKVEE